MEYFSTSGLEDIKRKYASEFADLGIEVIDGIIEIGPFEPIDPNDLYHTEQFIKEVNRYADNEGHIIIMRPMNLSHNILKLLNNLGYEENEAKDTRFQYNTLMCKVGSNIII